MKFQETGKVVEGTSIKLYYHEKVGYYVKSSDIPEYIGKKLRGITCIIDDNKEMMVPERDIKDIIKFGRPTD